MYCIFINTTVIWGPAQKSIIIWKDTNTRVIHCWQNSWKKNTRASWLAFNRLWSTTAAKEGRGGNKAHVITWLCKTYHPYTRHTTYILVCISVYLNMYIYLYICILRTTYSTYAMPSCYQNLNAWKVVGFESHRHGPWMTVVFVDHVPCDFRISLFHDDFGMILGSPSSLRWMMVTPWCLSHVRFAISWLMTTADDSTTSEGLSFLNREGDMIRKFHANINIYLICTCNMCIYKYTCLYVCMFKTDSTIGETCRTWERALLHSWELVTQDSPNVRSIEVVTWGVLNFNPFILVSLLAIVSMYGIFT